MSKSWKNELAGWKWKDEDGGFTEPLRQLEVQDTFDRKTLSRLIALFGYDNSLNKSGTYAQN